MDGGRLSIINDIRTSHDLKIISNSYENDLQYRYWFTFPSIDLNNYFPHQPNIDFSYATESNKYVSSNNSSNSGSSSNYKYNFGGFENFKFKKLEFKPSNATLNYIFQKENPTIQCKELYSKYCLYSYAAIYINITDNVKQEILIHLLLAFTRLTNVKFQKLINRAFADLFTDYLKEFTKFTFEIIFVPICEFFEKAIDDCLFSIFPELLQLLIKEYGFDLDSLTAQFTSLIQNILTVFSPTDETIASSIFKICNPYFQKLNDSALSLLCFLPQFLDEYQVDAFFTKFPFCFESFVDSDQPLFERPQKVTSFCKFDPIQSPSSLTHFYDKNLTFQNGLDAEFLIQCDDYNLMPFLRSDLLSKMTTVLQILDNGENYTRTFLTSFNELINLKIDSPSHFDYIAMYIYILLKIKPHSSLEIPIPMTLFDPSFEINEPLHILRMNAIHAFLNFDLKNLEILLRDSIKFPYLMTEISDIFCELTDVFVQKVSRKARFLRVFKEVGSAYQYEDINFKQTNSSNTTNEYQNDFNNELNNESNSDLKDELNENGEESLIDREIIEMPRISLLRFFTKIFKYDDVVISLMKDEITLQFFLSHLFEISLQPLMFDQMNLYISKYDVSEEFVSTVLQFFMQIIQLLPDDNGMKLLTNILSIFIKSSKSLQPFLILDNALCQVIDLLDSSDLSWQFLEEIFRLLTSESMEEFTITEKMYNSLENSLLRNSYNDEKVFEKLIQLLAGTFISNSDMVCEVKNFNVLNLLFKVFRDSSKIDIFSYSLKLCRYSYMNCVGCHKCGFDSLLIDYLHSYRIKLHPKINTVFLIIVEIMKVVSNPYIVQKIISLFTPFDSQFITPLHPLLIKNLQILFDDELNSPSHFISLIQSHHANIPMNLYNGFTFTCWIYIDLSTKAHILTLYSDNEPIITLKIDSLIYINGKSTFVQIPKRKWTFLAITLSNGNQLELYTDSVKIKEIEFSYNLKFKNNNFTAQIGGNESNSGRLGNFGFYQYFNHNVVKSIYLSGPRASDIENSFNPFYYADMHKIREFNLLSNIPETKTFSTILLQSFYVETFLPLFAQLDLQMKFDEGSNIINNFNAVDIANLLDSAFATGLYKEFDFSVLSHLLSNSSPKHLTFNLYKTFYSIYQKISNNIYADKQMKDAMFHFILANFDLWYPALNDEHIQILKFIKENKILTDLMKTLLILRVFYWYNPSEPHQIRGILDSDRPRDADLDVKLCRRTLLATFYDYEINDYQFSEIINHCMTIVDDNYQIYDLLDFLQHANVKHIRDESFRVIHFLFNNKDDTLVCLTISAIISIHKRLKFEGFTLADHLGQIFIHLAPRKFNGPVFLESCIGMLHDCPQLFEFCSYLSMCRKDTTLYQRIKPSNTFCSRESWALWSVINAMNTGGEEENEIFRFLIKCSHDKWIDIFDSIRISSFAFHLSFFEHRTKFLLELSQYVINNSSIIGQHSALIAISMIYFVILCRKPHQCSFSKHLYVLFQNSPFACNLRPRNSNQRKKVTITNFLNPYQLVNDEITKLQFSFGLKVDQNGEWADIELGIFSIFILLKFKITKFYSAAFVIAAYLLKSNSEAVKSWFEKMEISQKEREANFEYFEFFIQRLHNIGSPLPDRLETLIENIIVDYEKRDKNNKFFDVSKHYVNLVTFIKNFCDSSYINSKEFSIDQDSVNHVIDSSANYICSIQAEFEQNLRNWEKLWRNMIIIGGPWHFSQDKEPKWKRDFSNCSFYCPMKLKKNNHFDIHLQASLTREIGNATNAEIIVREFREKLEDEYKANAPHNLLSFSDEFDQTMNRSASVNEIMQSDTFVRSTSMPKIPPSNRPSLNSANSFVNSSNIANIIMIKRTISQMQNSIKCELIKATKDINATLSISSHSKIIRIVALKTGKIYDIKLSRIMEIFLRCRFHHHSAIEIFCIDGKSFFINFTENNPREIIDRIEKVRYLPNCSLIQMNYDFADFFERQQFTSKWTNGLISNFEYLMKLNIFSGRSFNDVSLYPFLPWVVTKFNMDNLDFNDLSLFRDLSKPIGAISENRIEELRERMQGMIEANEEEPYLYFAYVICPLAVFLFLIRMEPFTSLHIKMQSGKFDHGSRIFSSISDSYNSASSSLNNYRELPPDFYFCPETLINENGFDFGTNKHGVVDDVFLPKWVKDNNAYEFVYLMRKALESDFVSEHLNDWIDLVWGYKQRGEEAFKADNVYSSQLYDTIWTPENLHNQNRRAEIEATLCHVGQIPPQLFKEKHPQRNIIQITPVITKTCIWNFGVNKLPDNSPPEKYSTYTNSNNINSSNNVEVVISAYIKFISRDQLIFAFCSNEDTREILFSLKEETVKQVENIMTKQDFPEHVKHFADESCYILNSGKLEIKSMNNTLQEKVSLVSVFQQRSTNPIVKNSSSYSSLSSVLHSYQNQAHTKYYAFVVDDSTLLLNGPDLFTSIPFYGEKILCVDISSTFKSVVVGTSLNHIFICSLFEGIKINVLEIPEEYIIQKIHISPSWGFIVSYCEFNPNYHKPFNKNKTTNNENSVNNSTNDDNRHTNCLFVFNVNGRLIRKIKAPFQVTCWFGWESRQAFDYITFGTADGRIFATEIFYFELKESLYRSFSPIKAITYNEEAKVIAAVTENCQMIFLPH